jgi:hypothetical protein
MRNITRSTFKAMQVGQSAKPFCSSDEFHPLSAAWAKRRRGRGIVSLFVEHKHKRNSVLGPRRIGAAAARQKLIDQSTQAIIGG